MRGREIVFIALAFLASTALLAFSETIQAADVLPFVLVLVFVVLAFARAQISFLFLFFVRPIIDMFWGEKVLLGMSPLYLVGGLVPAFVLIYAALRRWGLIAIRGSGALLLFLGSCMLSFAVWYYGSPASLGLSSITILKVVSAHCVFFVMGRVFEGKEWIRKFTTVVLVSVLSAYAVTAFQYFTGGVTVQGEVDADSAFYMNSREGFLRISGVYEGTYELAYFSLYVLFFGAFIQPRIKSRVLRLALYAYMAVAAYVLFRTYVRVAWAMLAFAPLLVAVMRRRYRQAALATAFVGALVLAVGDIRVRFADEVGWARGEVDFAQVGASRGSIWIRYTDLYLRGDAIDLVLGRRGLGNPESQPLYILGYFGLAGFVIYYLMMMYFCLLLYQSFRYFQRARDDFMERFSLLSFVMFVDFFVFAGIGTQQFVIVSSQWILFSLASISIWQWQRSVAAAAAPSFAARRAARALPPALAAGG